MSQHVTVLCWNLKRNGAGDTTKRRRAHELLASLDPHLVLRQEMDGAAADGNRIMYEVEAVLGLRGFLGPRACTAVFANPTLFQPLRECEDVGPVWVHPPTVAVFRFTPGGSQSLPLVVASYHLNHASATTRQAEVERLTKWADRKWTMPDGERMLMPALMGGDNNSYPVPGLEGDLPLPDLEQIADRPHRLHRSHIGPDGQRLLDTCPDEALRTMRPGGRGPLLGEHPRWRQGSRVPHDERQSDARPGHADRQDLRHARPTRSGEGCRRDRGRTGYIRPPHRPSDP